MDELCVRWSLTRVGPTLLAGSSSSYGGGRYRTGDILSLHFLDTLYSVYTIKDDL